MELSATRSVKRATKEKGRFVGCRVRPDSRILAHSARRLNLIPAEPDMQFGTRKNAKRKTRRVAKKKDLFGIPIANPDLLLESQNVIKNVRQVGPTQSPGAQNPLTDERRVNRCFVEPVLNGLAKGTLLYAIRRATIRITQGSGRCVGSSAQRSTQRPAV